MKDLSLEHKAAVLLGMKEGGRAVDKYIASGGKEINGWQSRLVLRRSRLLSTATG